MKNSFDETVSDETYDAATAWLQGFEKMAGSLEARLPSGVRETMIFSLLGSSLLINLREMLNVNTDNLTVENQRDAAAMVQEFAKIFMWIGGNVQELYKEVPGVD
jgi:hypothetical protein